MATRFRTTWIGLALLVVASWLLTSPTGEVAPAGAEPTLRPPILEAQFVALRDGDEDGRDFGDDDDDFQAEEEEFDEDEDDFDEEDLEEMLERLEVERAHLEVRRAELQATFGELELIQEITSIAKDADKTAALAVLAAGDSMEPEALIPFLQEVANSTSSATVKRLARMKLAEAYDHADQPDKAIQQLRSLALGD